MFVKLIEEMRFCWVGPRAISISTIVLQCLDKWILVICNYWLGEACSKYFDLSGESETMVCPSKLLQTFNRLFEEVGFCREGPWTMVEQPISAPTLGQLDHNDMWLLTYSERHVQKIFSWVTKVKQRMQIQVLLWVLYSIFRESASQRVWPGTEKHDHTNQLARTI